MDPFIALAIIGLAAVGITITAIFFFSIISVAACGLLWAIALILVLAGMIDDYLYDKKVAAGKAEFRLPFYYRWRGWSIGTLTADMVGYGHKSATYHDHARDRIVPMVRAVLDSER